MRAALGIIACAVTVLLSTPLPLAAQGGTVQGRVTDPQGAPLAGATVTVEGTALGAITDDRGNYAITGVPAGSYTLRVQLLGYAARSTRVTVREGAAVRRDFSLREEAIGVEAIEVVVGSRARHTAADELAVPVDVFTAEEIRQTGTVETSDILKELSPSVNFQRQSIADATDIVRPFTMRGLSPDQTLVLVNGRRRHRTALTHRFGAGMGAGSSGVDMNALPASAIDRIEVLRDGAAAQYGSDAIAGVVNVVLREGPFDPTVSIDVGR